MEKIQLIQSYLQWNNSFRVAVGQRPELMQDRRSVDAHERHCKFIEFYTAQEHAMAEQMRQFDAVNDVRRFTDETRLEYDWVPSAEHFERPPRPRPREAPPRLTPSLSIVPPQE